MTPIIRRTIRTERATPVACFCWTVLAAIPVSATIAAADSRQASWDRRPELKKAGYVELVGADAARFLVGNSVLVQKSGPIDSEKYGIEISAGVYYFLNDHTMYECHAGKEADCFVRPWGYVNDQICLDTVPGCNDRTGIAIMKSPVSQARAKSGGKIGIYVSFNHYVYDIVSGNRTDGPFFDSRISGQPIALSRTDYDKEVEAASQDGGRNKAITISGPRALSLLIGNTFLSEDATKPVQDPATNACPEEGTYYSPDGRLIRFNCSSQMWSTSILHWKIKSGLICRDGPDPADIGKFDYCKPAKVKAIFSAQGSGTNGEMLVQDLESGNALTGYAGNVLSFEFSRRSDDKSDTK